MKQEQNGYVTLYLSLILGIMLTLVFVLLEGVRNETIRTEAEIVTDIGLYSAFGEFHRQLLEKYDLLFVDTSYGQGRPNVKQMEEHIQYYMNENFHKEKGIWEKSVDLTNLNCDNVVLECYMYASDNQGQVLKAQIVDYMQNKKGISSIETILSEFQVLQKGNYLTMDISAQWDEEDKKLNRLLEEKKKETDDQEEKEESPIGVDNPADYVKSVKGQGILGLVIPSQKEISAMTIHPEYYLSHRNIAKGVGLLTQEETLADTITKDWLLQEYLIEKCGSYKNNKQDSVLKYQLEYLLSGKDSDVANLEAVINKILFIREAINFVSLISDSQKVGEADSLAALLSVLLASPEIKDALKATILFAWCYAESVKDVKIILDGNKLPILKTKQDWNTPLSQLMMFTSYLEDYEVKNEGVGYEDYLKFFLIMETEKNLLYRFMDLCEMDIRITEGNEYFQMDGCINAVKAKINISSGYGNGYEITRTYQY